MSGGTTAPGSGRRRLNVLLYVLVVLLVGGVVVGGVLAARERTDRAERTLDDGEARLYQEVLSAAVRQAEAFVNVDHENLQQSIDAVRAGSTGTFREQYDASLDGLREIMQRNESVMTGEVIAAGVVAADRDDATVLVATTGTVANTETGGEEQQRNLRLQLVLVREDGRWLTSDLQFVG